MITQKTTYHPNYIIKSYKEFYNDILITHEKYDKRGNKTFEIDDSGEWTKYRYDKRNNIIYCEEENGHWEKKKYDKNNNISLQINQSEKISIKRKYNKDGYILNLERTSYKNINNKDTLVFKIIRKEFWSNERDSYNRIIIDKSVIKSNDNDNDYIKIMFIIYALNSTNNLIHTRIIIERNEKYDLVSTGTNSKITIKHYIPEEDKLISDYTIREPDDFDPEQLVANIKELMKLNADFTGRKYYDNTKNYILPQLCN